MMLFLVSGKDLLPNVYALGFTTGQTFAHLLQAVGSTDWREVLSTLLQFPILYKDWWLQLVAKDPIHVFVETTLLLSLAYMTLVNREKKSTKWINRLTPMEEKELLLEWKQTRAPLVPPPSIPEYGGLGRVIVHSNLGRTLQVELENDDSNDDNERRNGSKKSAKAEGSVGEINNSSASSLTTTPAEETDDTDEKKKMLTVLNFATFDFWGMSSPQVNAPIVKKAAHDALDRYGCGACGPRGFYGTIDVHLQLEQKIASYFGTEQAILYSDGASTCSSTVAAFCKRGDLVVVDDGIYEPLLTGVTLSRAHVKWFKHNDMADLRRVLEKIALSDKQRGRPLNAQRRFLIVEGLYKNSGTICKLDELVKLKHEFSYRLLLDESYSFGVLGATGRGVHELYHKRLQYDAEIVTVGLEQSVGSIGGVTIGTQDIVEHQRLSGSGYCFSASAPPFTAAAAMAALDIMQTKPQTCLQQIQSNIQYMYQQLEVWCKTTMEGLLLVASDTRSPIVVLQVATMPETRYLNQVVFLEEVVRESLYKGVAVSAIGCKQQTPPSRSAAVAASPAGPTPVKPGIRMTVTAFQTHADIDQALESLRQAVDIVMSRFHDEEEEHNSPK